MDYETVRKQLGLSKLQMNDAMSTLQTDTMDLTEVELLYALSQRYHTWHYRLETLVAQFEHITVEELADILGMAYETCYMHFKRFSSPDDTIGYGTHMLALVRPSIIDKFFEANAKTFSPDNPNSSKARRGLLSEPFLKWLELSPAQREQYLSSLTLRMRQSPNRTATPLWVQNKELEGVH